MAIDAGTKMSHHPKLSLLLNPQKIWGILQFWRKLSLSGPHGFIWPLEECISLFGSLRKHTFFSLHSKVTLCIFTQEKKISEMTTQEYRWELSQVLYQVSDQLHVIVLLVGIQAETEKLRILSLAIRFQKPQVHIGLVPLDLNADLFKLLRFLRE